MHENAEQNGCEGAEMLCMAFGIGRGSLKWIIPSDEEHRETTGKEYARERYAWTDRGPLHMVW